MGDVGWSRALNGSRKSTAFGQSQVAFAEFRRERVAMEYGNPSYRCTSSEGAGPRSRISVASMLNAFDGNA